MPASNVFRLGLALQSAKGTPATTPQYWVDVTSSDIGPTPETEQRSETGLGRDPGETYIRVLGAGGSASVILRPQTAPLFLYGALGAKAATQLGTAWVASTAYTVGNLVLPTNTGTNPYIFEVTTAGTSSTTEPVWPTAEGATVTNGTVVFTNRGALKYNHALTPSNDQPYLTLWRSLGDMIYEQFMDCKITGCNIEWAAGGDVTASISAVGLSFQRLTSEPAGGTYDNAAPLRVPGVVYTIEGAVDNSLTQGNVNVEANQTPIQTVEITNSYLEPGPRNITLGWEQVATDVTRYAKTYYGGATGTEPSKKVYEGAVKFDFGNVAYGPGLTLDLPRVGFTETPANPDPGGDPLRYPVAGQAFRPQSGSIITANVKNSVAAYAA
ncbi:MAG: hypothetical protein KY393_06385 [Actinobacteria bacterium]|nr:hypothetical protein [Actinomycetota bacterium]